MTHPTRKMFAEIRQEIRDADSSSWNKYDSADVWHRRGDVMFHMAPGKARRAEIIRLLQANIDIRVDCKYSIQVKNDRDVQRLISTGVCEIYKIRTWWNSSKKYLRLKRSTA